MDSGLAGRVVAITGAAGGIGRALADAFAAEGARLVLTADSSFAELERLAGARGWKDALLLRADVTRPESLDAAFAEAARLHGRIDCCVANAGIWPPDDVPLQRMDPARLRRTIEIDLVGAAFTARAFLRELERAGPRPNGAASDGAALVFIGSTAGRFGERGHADYAMAKAGLTGLVKSLKNEIVAIDRWGRVNLIDPGWTATEMARPALQDDARVARALSTMALRQLARAEDIARAALFLCSPKLARHVSGEALLVAGGMEGRQLWDAGEVGVERARGRLARDV